MKILHVFPSPHAGGSELCALETIQGLNKDGIESYALFPTQGSMAERVEPFVKNKFIISYDWWVSNPEWSFYFKLIIAKGFFISAWKIRKIIKANNIDIVLTHTMTIPSASLAAYISGVKHIWYIHEFGDLDHHFKFNYGRARMLSFINKFSSYIFFNSKTIQGFFKSYFNPNKSGVLYNPVNYPLRKSTSKKISEEFTICMVGRIGKGKNQLLALKALLILKNEYKIFPTLYLVGGANQEYLDIVKTFIRKNELDNQVQLTGHTDSPWEYLYRSDCALVCSDNEAFGRVVIEAMKSSVLALVSNSGAAKEIIKDGVTGLLFETQNEISLAQQLNKIYMSDYSENIVENAYEHAVTNFNEQNHRNAILEVIRGV